MAAKMEEMAGSQKESSIIAKNCEKNGLFPSSHSTSLFLLLIIMKG